MSAVPDPRNDLDLLLTGVSVITDPVAGAVVRDAAVGIRGDRIAFVGPAAEAAALRAVEALDLDGHVVLPGFVDGYARAELELARGLADGVPATDRPGLEGDLRHRLGPAARAAGAELMCVELVLAGVTGCIDRSHPAAVDAIAPAFVASGLRAVLAVDATEGDLDAWLAVANSWHGAGDGRLSVWPWIPSPATVGDDVIRATAALAASRGVSLFVDAGIEADGEVERLDRLGVLGPRTVLGQTVHLSLREAELIRHRGARPCHVPNNSMHAGLGVSVRGRIPDLLRLGVPVFLGSGGPLGGGVHDVMREAQLAALVHKEMRADPTLVSARAAIAMATIRGAQACAWTDSGTVAVGGRADLIAVSLQGVHARPAPDVFSALVYAASSRDVRLTIAGGRVVLRERRPVGVDLDRVLEAAERHAGQLAA